MFCNRQSLVRTKRVRRSFTFAHSPVHSQQDREPDAAPLVCLIPGRARSHHICRCGFTLVELMVVIVIIGLLAGVVTFSVRGYLITSKQNIAKMEISKVVQALETYYTIFDRYPSNEEGLTVLAQASEKFPDGILTKVPRDPWGSPYQYNSPGRSVPYEVISYGADHREGGDSGDRDISNVELGDVKK